MVDEIENVESVNLVLSPSQLSDLAIPDEMIPDDVKISLKVIVIKWYLSIQQKKLQPIN